MGLVKQTFLSTIAMLRTVRMKFSWQGTCLGILPMLFLLFNWGDYHWSSRIDLPVTWVLAISTAAGRKSQFSRKHVKL